MFLNYAEPHLGDNWIFLMCYNETRLNGLRHLRNIFWKNVDRNPLPCFRDTRFAMGLLWQGSAQNIILYIILELYVFWHINVYRWNTSFKALINRKTEDMNIHDVKEKSVLRSLISISIALHDLVRMCFTNWCVANGSKMRHGLSGFD